MVEVSKRLNYMTGKIMKYGVSHIITSTLLPEPWNINFNFQ